MSYLVLLLVAIIFLFILFIGVMYVYPKYMATTAGADASAVKSNYVEVPDLNVRREWTESSLVEQKLKNAQLVANELLHRKVNAERIVIDENLAYFAHPACSGEGEENYATNAYGKQGGTFMDWVGGNLISPEMEKNHQEYVENDLSLLGVGNAMSYDMHDSYNAIDWKGLMRPQNVPTSGLQDQLPDIDKSLYEDHQTIRF